MDDDFPKTTYEVTLPDAVVERMLAEWTEVEAVRLRINPQSGEIEFWFTTDLKRVIAAEQGPRVAPVPSTPANFRWR